MSAHVTGARALGVAEIAYGAALLVPVRVWPQPLAATGSPDLLQDAARALAGRQLLQGVLTLALPERRTVRWGAVVDALHAASMVALAVAVPAARRPAAASAALALVAAGRGRSLSRR